MVSRSGWDLDRGVFVCSPRYRGNLGLSAEAVARFPLAVRRCSTNFYDRNINTACIDTYIYIYIYYIYIYREREICVHINWGSVSRDEATLAIRRCLPLRDETCWAIRDFKDKVVICSTNHFYIIRAETCLAIGILSIITVFAFLRVVLRFFDKCMV